MQRRISLLLIFAMLCALLSGCSFTVKDGLNVEFYVGDELYATSSVSMGKSVASHKAPDFDNLIFIGWFYDKACTIEHDFSLPVLVDLKLYAGYTIDAVAVSDMVNNTLIKSIVTVQNKSYNVGYAGVVETSATISAGSGVVIDISGGYCYVLTNCHVAKKEEGYAKLDLTVEDAWGNKFEAQVYQSSKSDHPAISEDYDLALICFKYTPPKETQTLVEIGVANDPLVNDYVIALGTPGGIKNTSSLGKVISYSKIDLEESDDSNVRFDIIVHDANINHGSSGGPLLNINGELVGINYAGYGNGEFGCAIPMSRVNSFLDTYVYVK